jgi:ankyrin repeat protein
MIHAIATGNVGEVERLLANGADVNAKNSREETPLHEAVSFQRV